MAGPYTIQVVEDVPLSTTRSIIRDERGRTLPEASRIKCYANRETVDVFFTTTVGANEVTSDAGAAVNATAGDLPSTRDDLLFDTFGNAGEEIVIRARNQDGAAAREARVTLFIVPVDDDILQSAMNMLGV